MPQNPLQIIALIKKTVLDQTKYQNIFATVYEQKRSIYIFSQNTLRNEKWYEHFNTKIDVESAIRVTQEPPTPPPPMSHVTEEHNNQFEYMTPE